MTRKLLIAMTGILLHTFSASLWASNTSIVIEKIDSGNKEELAFSVSVLNHGNEPLNLNTEHGDVAHYQVGEFDTEKENEAVFLKSDVSIPAGEQKIVRYFKHDLKAHPLGDLEKVEIKVKVANVGEVTQVLDLEHPGFFEGFMKDLLGVQIEGPADQPSAPAENERKVLFTNSEDSSEKSSPKNSDDSENVNEPTDAPSESTGLEASLLNHEPLASDNASVETSEESAPPTLEEPAPPIPVVNAGAAAFDTTPPAMPGVNSYPTRTRESSQTVSGTKELGSIVWINVDGVDVATTDNQSTWIANIPLKEGINVVRFEARDQAGNRSAFIQSFSYRDTVLPTIQTIDISSITQNSAQIYILASEMVKYRLTYGITGEAATQSVTFDFLNLNHTFTLNNLQPQKEYSFFVTIEDQVAFTAVSSTQTFSTVSNQDIFEAPVEAPSGETPIYGGGIFTLPDMNHDFIDEYGTLKRPNAAEVAAGAGISYYAFYVFFSSADGIHRPENAVRFSNFGTHYSTDYKKAMPIGDLNGDQFTDIALITPLTATVLMSRKVGDNVVFDIGPILNTEPMDLVLTGSVTLDPYYENFGDFNGDGVVDLIGVESHMANRPGGGQSILYTYYLILSNVTNQNYNSQFAQTIRLSFPTAEQFANREWRAASDLNGDDREEVMSVERIFNTNRTRLRTFFSPNFTLAQSVETILEDGQLFPTEFGVGQNNIGDVDGDGIEEIFGHLLGNISAGHVETFGAAIIYLNSDASVKRIQHTGMVRSYQTVRVGDYNSDGIRDMAFVVRPERQESSTAGVIVPAEPTNHSPVPDPEGYGIMIFLSKNGGFDFEQGPDVHLDFYAGGGPQNSSLLALDRSTNVTKTDLVYRAQVDVMTSKDILFKQK